MVAFYLMLNKNAVIDKRFLQTIRKKIMEVIAKTKVIRSNITSL